MKVVRDGLWLCADCRIAAVNGDFTGIESDERVKEVEAGLERLGAHLVNDEGENGEGYDEFKWRSCDCCRTNRGGERFRFAILGAD